MESLRRKSERQSARFVRVITAEIQKVKTFLCTSAISKFQQMPVTNVRYTNFNSNDLFIFLAKYLQISWRFVPKLHLIIVGISESIPIFSENDAYYAEHQMKIDLKNLDKS